MTSNHGGSRQGSGRKALYEEPTKVIRVPESKVIEIKQFLAENKKPIFNDVASITQVDPTTFMRIPLASEKVSAGFPSPAQDYIEQTLDMNEHLIKNEAATFVVTVSSQSMLGAGIDINDELVVDRSLEAKHEDIVVVWIDNEFTVKRMMITQQMSHQELFDIFHNDNELNDLPAVWLKPENIEYQPILPRSEQELVIWGVVTKVIKNFK